MLDLPGKSGDIEEIREAFCKKYNSGGALKPQEQKALQKRLLKTIHQNPEFDSTDSKTRYTLAVQDPSREYLSL